MQDEADRERSRAALAERLFARAWAGALGGRRHADMPVAPPRRPAVARAASVPRVIGLPLAHSPVPCALGFLQRGAERDGARAAAGIAAMASHGTEG